VPDTPDTPDTPDLPDTLDQPDALAAVRRGYEERGLVRSDLDPDPLVQFRRWFDDAVASGLYQPEGMVIASASAAAEPSARMVLLRGADERGFTFFTNYESRKGEELEHNPVAAALFPWHTIARQIRITGPVARIDPAESDAYFASRPRGSQLSAWASPQSGVVEDRAALEQRRVEQEARWGDGPIARPPFWGGYRLAPHEIELWQGRANRFHDRFRYRRGGDGWILERLAP
jgi:pyridoxamine 5'-phosphate oxidase